jgi:FKBP-type peptidyl-prolyl cis-trans isomerase FkpA
MRYVSIFFLAVLILQSLSCTKETVCKPATVKEDEAKILSYATANGITAQKHSSGLYYQVISTGTGEVPNTSSVISITYTGKLTNNDIFDEQMDATQTNWRLSSLIQGWQIGLPLIKKGGKIILLVPAALAYGCASPGGAIPANSILVFDINLVDVK